MAGSEGLGTSSWKHCWELCPGLGAGSCGYLALKGPLSASPSWLPGSAKPALWHTAGSADELSPVIYALDQILDEKTNVPNYDFHVWFRRHFKIPEPRGHCFQVSNPPGEAIRNWAVLGQLVSRPLCDWIWYLFVILPCSRAFSTERQTGLHFE